MPNSEASGTTPPIAAVTVSGLPLAGQTAKRQILTNPDQKVHFIALQLMYSM